MKTRLVYCVVSDVRGLGRGGVMGFGTRREAEEFLQGILDDDEPGFHWIEERDWEPPQPIRNWPLPSRVGPPIIPIMGGKHGRHHASTGGATWADPPEIHEE